VEVLARGQSLQAHQLTVTHSAGELVLDNPGYRRGSVDGVIALLTPIGEEPLREGLREVAVAGFGGEPVFRREGASVTVEAEGLRIAFDGARVERDGDTWILTLPPAAADGLRVGQSTGPATGPATRP